MRGGISGDLAAFPATNKALRAAEGPEEGNESHGDLNRYSGKSPVTKNTVLLLRITHLEAPTPLDRGGISGDFTGFFFTNRALRAVKGTKKGNASHVGLTWHCGKSLVTTSAVLRRVQLTWKHPRRKIEVVFQVIEPTFPPQTGP